MRFEKIKGLWAALCSFTLSESKGILLLLPMLIAIGLIISTLNKPRIEKSFPMLADMMIDSAKIFAAQRYVAKEEVVSELFTFDPNTIDYHDLRRLGFTSQAAAGLIRYRTKYGKVFELPTDFAACYQVNDSIFERLEPYIVIGEQFKVHAGSAESRRSVPKSAAAELFAFDPNALDSTGFRRLGFSARQTQSIINYRRMIGGFESVEQFGECYCVTDRIGQLRPYINIVAAKVAADRRIELNGADVEALVKIRGIGLLTAQRIVAYREKLGGFFDKRQLAEVEGVNEKNFELFSKEIYVDSSGITKIDVNFAPAEIMSRHPYLSGPIIRKALKYKQLKGGLRSIEEMINDKILSKAEAEKLSHYLVFTPFTQK